EKALAELLPHGNQVIPALRQYATNANEPLGAANALWTMLRIDTSESKADIALGAKHSDWKVRRLALNIMRRYQVPGTEQLAAKVRKDDDPAVRLEAALARKTDADKRADLLNVLTTGAAKDAHLRYEAAWHLAKVADLPAFEGLLRSEDEAVRL